MNISTLFKEYHFTSEEKLYTYIGLVLLLISAGIALTSYIVWPVLTGVQLYLASVFVHSLLTLTALILLWLGLGAAIKSKAKSVDRKLSVSLWYRITRNIVVYSTSFLVRCFTIVLDIWLDTSTNNRTSNRDHDQDDHYGYTDNGHEGWDSSEKGWESAAHFYDDEPPPPFS